MLSTRLWPKIAIDAKQERKATEPKELTTRPAYRVSLPSIILGLIFLLAMSMAYTVWLSSQHQALLSTHTELHEHYQQQLGSQASQQARETQLLLREIADLHLEIVNGKDEVLARDLLLKQKDEILAQAEGLDLVAKFNLALSEREPAQAFSDLEQARKSLGQQRLLMTLIPSGKPFAEDQKYRISSKYGRRLHPVYKRWHTHSGLDFGMKRGSEVQSTADGVVSYVGSNGGYGKTVVINHSYGFKTYYSHLSKILVDHGEIVRKNQLIALSGSSGVSTGPHLHYEIRYLGEAIDPINFANWSIKTFDHFFGAQENQLIDWNGVMENVIYREEELSTLAQLDGSSAP